MSGTMPPPAQEHGTGADLPPVGMDAVLAAAPFPRIRELGRSFATTQGEIVNALSSADLDIAPGQFVSVVGRSRRCC